MTRTRAVAAFAAASASACRARASSSARSAAATRDADEAFDARDTLAALCRSAFASFRSGAREAEALAGAAVLLRHARVVCVVRTFSGFSFALAGPDDVVCVWSVEGDSPEELPRKSMKGSSCAIARSFRPAPRAAFAC